MSKWTPCEGFWKSRGLPDPIAEFKFHPLRLWRFDFCWAHKMIAIEVEGGTWMGGGFGGHNRGSGMARDMAKYNFATRMGWNIYRFTPEQLEDDEYADSYPKTYKGERERVSEFLRKVLIGEI